MGMGVTFIVPIISVNVDGGLPPMEEHVIPAGSPSFSVGTARTALSGLTGDVLNGNQRLKRQELPYGTVAFYAALSRTVANLGVNQNIVFDHVILNEGNGYSGHAGDFRAPVSGIYAFSVSLQSYYGHSTHYTIMQGTTLVGKLYVDGHAAGMENSGMSFVLKLQKNEDVSVKNADLGENLHGDHYTSFSGFLVAEIEDSPVVDEWFRFPLRGPLCDTYDTVYCKAVRSFV
ncbi:CBLN3-like protein [Mya arenaria]|uniref:CBLN3-like protein n=1 Tax=Mya arenaria TaxID=6604 RepID=A0ABY7EBY8_MYAAR|nr:CBLN3-like protein [Mya arenaria]